MSSDRSRFVLVITIFLLCVSNISMGFVARHAEQKADRAKSDSEFYLHQAVQNEQNYENALKELNDAKADLSAAQARARAAQARASRSRLRTVSDLPRAYSGGTRDITMYCSGTITASGKTPRPGMVATLDRSIHFGTRIAIEGLGEYIVEDRIGSGSEFDLYSNSCSAARQFGRQHRRVTIL